MPPPQEKNAECFGWNSTARNLATCPTLFLLNAAINLTIALVLFGLFFLFFFSDHEGGMRLSEQKETGLLQYNTPPVLTHNSVSKYSGTDRLRVQCLQISL